MNLFEPEINCEIILPMEFKSGDIMVSAGYRYPIVRQETLECDWGIGMVLVFLTEDQKEHKILYSTNSMIPYNKLIKQ